MTNQTHIALLPGAGMGHLTPFLRFAAKLASSHDCTVTLVIAKPTVSTAESDHISHFLSAYPGVKLLEFQLLPLDSTDPTTSDPLFLQFSAISRSMNPVVQPLLSSLSPALSAVFCDFGLAASFSPVAADLDIPYYVLVTTSARFFCVMAYLPVMLSGSSALGGASDEVEIPGLVPLPKSSIPPPFFNPNHFFTKTTVSHAKSLQNATGVLINTFDRLEPETLAAVNAGQVLTTLSPVIPVGPLEFYSSEKSQLLLPWLERQPEKSVLYISFGSRTAMSKEQIRELGDGLEQSGCRFLWVLRTRKVDKDDQEELKEVLDDEFLERNKSKGKIVKGWVNQEEVLAHPAIGGFVNHCGWNSVVEAAWHGVPILAWPLHGDQRVNAEVLEKAGLGTWERGWGWIGEMLVMAVEIGEKIKVMMSDKNLRERARKIGEEVRKAVEIGGTSEKALTGLIEVLKKKN